MTKERCEEIFRDVARLFISNDLSIDECKELIEYIAENVDDLAGWVPFKMAVKHVNELREQKKQNECPNA